MINYIEIHHKGPKSEACKDTAVSFRWFSQRPDCCRSKGGRSRSGGSAVHTIMYPLLLPLLLPAPGDPSWEQTVFSGLKLQGKWRGHDPLRFLYHALGIFWLPQDHTYWSYFPVELIGIVIRGRPLDPSDAKPCRSEFPSGGLCSALDVPTSAEINKCSFKLVYTLRNRN